MHLYLINLSRLLNKALLGIIVLGIFISGYILVKQSLLVPVMTIADPIRQGDPGKKEIALTCNVFWGEEYLPKMLDILKKNNVKITFYIGGRWAEKFPYMLKKISRDGHEIGNHSYSHPHSNSLSLSKNKEQIKKTEDIIKNITGVKTNLYAPPYGEYNNTVLSAAEELGYRTILWSIDTIDWQRPSPDAIIERVIKKAHNGGIVLMHPTEPTAEALDVLIKKLKKEKYKIVKVSELLK